MFFSKNAMLRARATIEERAVFLSRLCIIGQLHVCLCYNKALLYLKTRKKELACSDLRKAIELGNINTGAIFEREYLGKLRSLYWEVNW